MKFARKRLLIDPIEVKILKSVIAWAIVKELFSKNVAVIMVALCSKPLLAIIGFIDNYFKDSCMYFSIKIKIYKYSKGKRRGTY